MRKIFIIIMLLILPARVFADTLYTITTGYAYVVRSGHNIGKLELSIGTQHYCITGDTLVEVGSKSDLDAIIYSDSPDITSQKADYVSAKAQCSGSVTLVAGQATVSTTQVTSNNKVTLDNEGSSTSDIGYLYVGSRNSGTSFVIKSNNPLDVSNVSWNLPCSSNFI